MKVKKLNKWFLMSATAALSAIPLAGRAQSADALIDKLVQKGVLTVNEAKDLREETDKNFTQAYSVKSGMPEWVTSLKFNGDFRGRFEENYADSSAYLTRDRYRYRVRFGITATLLDNFEVGLRLSSGNPLTNPGGTLVGGSSISANTDMNSFESRKFIWVDQAYAKWNALTGPNWTLTTIIGKMENPFALSSMVFDSDINPEGAAIQAGYRFNDKHALKFNGGFFVLDEINQTPGTPAPVPGGYQGISANHDPYIVGGQLIFESKWTEKLDTSIGVSYLTVNSKDSLSAFVQPFYNSGNTRDAVNRLLVHNYDPVIVSGSVTYKLDSFPFYTGAFPIKLAGEYMENQGARKENVGYRGGFTFGKAGHKGQWEINYRYQRLEADAWLDAMVDDDNGAYYGAAPGTTHPRLIGTGKANGWFGGTNVKGHQVVATYSLRDYLNFTLTYYINDAILNNPGYNSTAGHFMADLMWKF